LAATARSTSKTLRRAEITHTHIILSYIVTHLLQRDIEGDRALRDIKAGEELLNNYVFFSESFNEWILNVIHLKRMCNGEEVGPISQLEEL